MFEEVDEDALERSGSKGRLSPTELSDAVMMTSGGMTGRLDRLRRAGLVQRQPDPVDRRGVFVVLTSKGRETVRRVLPLHAEAARECLQSLGAKEVAALEELLRSMLLGFEGGLSEKDWIWSEGSPPRDGSLPRGVHGSGPARGRPFGTGIRRPMSLSLAATPGPVRLRLSKQLERGANFSTSCNCCYMM